jgi:hypothetical protein
LHGPTPDAAGNVLICMTPRKDGAIKEDIMVTLPDNIARVQVFWAADEDTYYTASTVASVLELSEQTLANWRVSGDGPAFVKKGRILYYRKAEVLAWLKGLGSPVSSTSQLQAA